MHQDYLVVRVSQAEEGIEVNRVFSFVHRAAKRLLRKRIALLSLSVGCVNRWETWGVAAAVMGIHFGVEMTRTHWVHAWIAAWPWSSWARSFDAFERNHFTKRGTK